MANFYYKKIKKRNKKFFIKIGSSIVLLSGIAILFYAFFPLLSWHIYFAPVFASQDVVAPIPKTTVVTSSALTGLLKEAANTLQGVDYTDAQTWFPSYNPQKGIPKIPSYTISIPKINIQNASVSTTDTDLTRHLVNYGGTAIPPEKGNAVIFGHSTLPQLFNPSDYKTIFANAYKLKNGDEILVSVGTITYRYQIISTIVVDPEDTSVLAQTTDDSYLTLITCTPPGTIWKRLIIKAKLQNL